MHGGGFVAQREITEVTDADVRASWDDLYTYEVAGVATRPLVPHPDDHLDQHMLAQLRKVLENDRRRVAKRESA